MLMEFISIYFLSTRSCYQHTRHWVADFVKVWEQIVYMKAPLIMTTIWSSLSTLKCHQSFLNVSKKMCWIFNILSALSITAHPELDNNVISDFYLLWTKPWGAVWAVNTGYTAGGGQCTFKLQNITHMTQYIWASEFSDGLFRCRQM